LDEESEESAEQLPLPYEEENQLFLKKFLEGRQFYSRGLKVPYFIET